jgi:hypothetical protein
MTRSSLLLFVLCMTSYHSEAQNKSPKDYAVNIEKLDVLNDHVYALLSPYRLVMVGEQHGSNEPAKFVAGLAELFANHGDSVLVGFEIPSKEMDEYLKDRTEKSIAQSKFFDVESTDGRASVAWAGAIAKLSKNSRITIFFYDVNADEHGDRDSLMYVNIRNNMLKHPAQKTITLSGNIHNRVYPYKQRNTTAAYLLNDKQLNLTSKLCSLDHRYLEGTARNNMGNGLEVHTLKNPASVYSTLGYDNYVMPFPATTDYPYTGMLYTKYITAAETMKQKK